MTIVYGNRDVFSIEIGDYVKDSDELRIVDVWAAKRWLTCDDNVAYLSQFVHSIREELNTLQENPRKMWGSRPFSNCSYIENHCLLLKVPKDVEHDDGKRFKYFFMDWGPTSDNVSMFLFRENGIANITFEFWRELHHEPNEKGVVFVTSMPEYLLEKLLSETANYLQPNYIGQA